jgi:transcription elongation factor GreA
VREVRELVETELRKLEHEYRIELPREIRTAVAMGDLRENAEYKAALERQTYVRARIGQLRQRLSELNAFNLAAVPRDRVGIGSKITLLNLDTDEELTYELVFPEVADLEAGWISIASPIGQGLVGRAPGDEVHVRIPSGEKRFEILALRTVHDTE